MLVNLSSTLEKEITAWQAQRLAGLPRAGPGVLFKKIKEEPRLTPIGRLQVLSNLTEEIPQAAELCRNALRYACAHPDPSVDPWLTNVLAFRYLDRSCDKEIADYLFMSIKQNLTNGSLWMLKFLTLSMERGYEIPLIQREVMLDSLLTLVRTASFHISPSSSKDAITTLCTFARLLHPSELSDVIVKEMVVPYIDSLVGNMSVRRAMVFIQAVQPCFPGEVADMIRGKTGLAESNKALKTYSAVLNKVFYRQGKSLDDWQSPVLLTELNGFGRNVRSWRGAEAKVAGSARLQDIVASLVSLDKHDRIFATALKLKTKSDSGLIRSEQIFQALDIVKKSAKIIQPETTKVILGWLVTAVQSKGTAFSVDDLVRLRDEFLEVDKWGYAEKLEDIAAEYIGGLKTLYFPYLLRNQTNSM